MNLYKLHNDPKSFKHHDYHHDIIPELFWDIYKDNPAELKKREKYLAKDSRYAFRYAHQVLHKPFPAGEDAIAKDNVAAIMYAINILKGKFPKGEDIISKDAEESYNYALSALKRRRFPKGEDAIANDPAVAPSYARDIIKGPWTHNGKTIQPEK